MKANKIFVMGAIVIAAVAFGILFWSKQTAVEQAAVTVPKANTALLLKPHSPIKGSADAKVTIVEFLDPECEACRSMHPIVKQLLKEYDGRVRLVIRYMPFHGNSKYAASALEEALEQGKFNEALDVLFEKQPQWADHGHPRPELIASFLKEAGVTGPLDQSSVIAKHGSKIDIDQADGIELGVQRTPTFFVNGVEQDKIGYGPLKQAIEKALQE